MPETYTHTVGGFAVKLPFHPDDVQVALGVLRIYLPADCSTSGAQNRIDDAFTRALLTLAEQGRRRYERDELEPQYRYERERRVKEHVAKVVAAFEEGFAGGSK